MQWTPNSATLLPAEAIAYGYGNSADEVLACLLISQQCSVVKLIMRNASARWNGGTRTITTESGVLKRDHYSPSFPLKSNFGTNPAELIAAAHAASFVLALSNELRSTDFARGDITTTATVTVEHLPAGWTIVNIHLHVVAKLPRMTQEEFIDATVRAKTNCLVSRLLRANISMSAKLEK